MRIVRQWQLRSIVAVLSFVVALSSVAVQAWAAEVYPTAVLPFQERGKEVKDLGAKVSDLLFAHLVANPEMFLVDREDLKKLIDEQELSLSGVVNPAEANKVGQLTGAKVLVTGSVLEVDTKLYLIAKIIGTETSRVVGSSVKGKTDDDLDGLVEQLAAQVVKAIADEGEKLVAKPLAREDRVAALKKQLGKAELPAVVVMIPERHVGQATIDPAAATEIEFFCQELGFTVVDSKTGNRSAADIMITGEGFSEFASRHGNLIAVKARVETKAVDRKTGRVLAVDRQTTVAVDLSEQIAAKSALQQAAAQIAERLLPKLVAPKGDKPDEKKKPAEKKKPKKRQDEE